MKKAQAQKLELLERIAALDDPKQIQKFMTFWDSVVESRPPGNVGELIALAEEGQREIEAGNYGTLDDLKRALKEGQAEGLRLRELKNKVHA